MNTMAPKAPKAAPSAEQIEQKRAAEAQVKDAVAEAVSRWIEERVGYTLGLRKKDDGKYVDAAGLHDDMPYEQGTTLLAIQRVDPENDPANSGEVVIKNKKLVNMGAAQNPDKDGHEEDKLGDFFRGIQYQVRGLVAQVDIGELSGFDAKFVVSLNDAIEEGVPDRVEGSRNLSYFDIGEK